MPEGLPNSENKEEVRPPLTADQIYNIVNRTTDMYIGQVESEAGQPGVPGWAKFADAMNKRRFPTIVIGTGTRLVGSQTLLVIHGEKLGDLPPKLPEDIVDQYAQFNPKYEPQVDGSVPGQEFRVTPYLLNVSGDNPALGYPQPDLSVHIPPVERTLELFPSVPGFPDTTPQDLGWMG